jgi:uncharacterized protein (TIGR02246 family)
MERNLVSDVAQIYQLWKEYADAINAGDFERWIALWTDDCLHAPPSETGPRQYGKDIIRARMGSGFASSGREMTVNTEEVDVLGEKAYSHGTFTLTVTPEGGSDKIKKIGNFLSILEKQVDGSWKIHIHTWND